ncbi:MAG: ABC transporter permease, partial [Bacteroidota bacterium]
MQAPPKLPLRILRWFCNEERLEELEGDLHELFQDAYEHNPRTATLDYWWMTFRSFRFYALKNSKQQKINSMIHFFILLKHQLRLILRQLWQQKTTTAINIVGLTIGLAGFITLYSLIRYEFSFNQHIPDSERIYRLYSTFSGSFDGYNRGITAGAGGYLRDNSHQEIEEVAQFIIKSFTAKPVSKDDKEGFKYVKSVFTDAGYFKVFSQYDWLAGDPSTALASPHQVVLTQQQAEKYFGPQSADQYIGQQITYRDSLQITVSGVVKQLEGNSDFVFTDFLSLATVRASWVKESIRLDDWNSTNSGSQLWVKTKQPIAEGVQPSFLTQLNEQIAQVSDNQDWTREIKTKPLSELHFDQQLSIFDNRGRAAADTDSLSILGVVCLALLLMAMFNFINLETANASGRAKEVGVIKVLGSSRGMIFSKFILQSIVLMAISVVFAIPLAELSLKGFSEFFPEEMDSNLIDLHLVGLTLILVAVIGILSGLYPAMRLSGISISRALKSNVRLSFAEKGTPHVRKVLVSFQFICSQVLIIVAIAVFFQIRYMLNKDLGFSGDHVLLVNTPWMQPQKKAGRLYHEMAKIPTINELNWQGSAPTSESYSSMLLGYQTPEMNEPLKTVVFRKRADTTYLDFYNIKLLAGRMFLPRPNLNEILVNEKYMEKIGVKDPADILGIKVSDDEVEYTIVGIMSNFHNLSLKSELVPVSLHYQAENPEIAFKVNPEDASAVIDQITEIYRDIYPKHPAQVKFMDETIRDFYKAEKKTEKLAVITTILAIIISSLGLFGLIAITVIQKTKEVGIRKVLGAGLWSLGAIISKEFLGLILIALV